MEEKRKKIGTELKPSLWDRMAEVALRRHIHLWQAHQEALERYLGSSAPAGLRSVPDPSPRPHADMHDTLDRILDSGHEVAIKAITENLRAFDRLISVDQPPGKKQRGARPRPEERRLG